jgi:hydrogenase maturation protease
MGTIGMKARIIGLGQQAAGDDAVGLAVLDWLRTRRAASDRLLEEVELMVAAEASALVPLLETPAEVVVVDAMLDLPPGEVREFAPEDLARGGPQPLSSHGVGVGQAIALARLLAPETVSPSIRIVAVTVMRPERYEHGLSPVVAAAVPRAAERILELLGD